MPGTVRRWNYPTPLCIGEDTPRHHTLCIRTVSISTGTSSRQKTCAPASADGSMIGPWDRTCLSPTLHCVCPPQAPPPQEPPCPTLPVQCPACLKGPVNTRGRVHNDDPAFQRFTVMYIAVFLHHFQFPPVTHTLPNESRVRLQGRASPFLPSPAPSQVPPLGGTTELRGSSHLLVCV